MGCLSRMNIACQGACGGHGRGNFSGDVTAFAHACEDHPTGNSRQAINGIRKDLCLVREKGCFEVANRQHRTVKHITCGDKIFRHMGGITFGRRHIHSEVKLGSTFSACCRILFRAFSTRCA